MMHKELLYKFFEGKASIDEEKQIRRWINQSEENEDIFLQERLTYDAIIFADTQTYDNIKAKSRKISIWTFSTVAAVMLLLIVSGMYFFNINNNIHNQYNTILVPPGQRINLILADQTNVWLNANTKFEYPSQFSKKNRTVYLDGEAYFDVSKNSKKPFLVKTISGDVRVTGTKFNVEAYSKIGNFETSLFEGGVDIYKDEEKLASLDPNQKSSLTDNKLLISEISDTDAFLWRHGLIAFQNKELEEILLSLEKYFDINIKVVSEKLPQHTYSGKFRQADGIDYALRVLQRSINFKYERDDSTNTIYII